MGRSVRRTYRPPMYRMIEILLQRVCEFIDRSYKKSQSVHMLADGLLHKIEDCLTYAAIIYYARDDEDKSLYKQSLTAIRVNMWSISTNIERIYFSAANTQHKFITDVQYANVLGVITQIESYYVKDVKTN